LKKYKKLTSTDRIKLFEELHKLSHLKSVDALSILSKKGFTKPDGSPMDTVFINNQRTSMKISDSGKRFQKTIARNEKKSHPASEDWQDAAMEIMCLKVSDELKARLLRTVIPGATV
jgi:hypothetical protein